jgi:hypothetical protein
MHLWHTGDVTTVKVRVRAGARWTSPSVHVIWTRSELSRVVEPNEAINTCRALGEREPVAGACLARMPDKQDAIRQLAYRHHTLCERRGEAQNARAGNELVTSGLGIETAADEVPETKPQLELFGGEK